MNRFSSQSCKWLYTNVKNVQNSPGDKPPVTVLILIVWFTPRRVAGLPIIFFNFPPSALRLGTCSLSWVEINDWMSDSNRAQLRPTCGWCTVYISALGIYFWMKSLFNLVSLQDVPRHNASFCSSECGSCDLLCVCVFSPLEGTATRWISMYRLENSNENTLPLLSQH